MDVGPPKMEKMGMKKLFSFCLMVVSIGCASKAPKYFKMEQLKQNQEFENTVQIVEPEAVPESGPVPDTNFSSTTTTLPVKLVEDKPKAKSKSKKDKKPPTKIVETAMPQRRQPEIEDDQGFNGRRPLQDPFRVGEKVIHNVSYFKVSAGLLTIETRPFAQVNGKKNYQFRTSIKSSSLFSSFYSADDSVDVLMDFDRMVPSVFTLHVKESAQLKEAQMYFDQDKNQATYWEKKVTEKSGEENKEETKKQEWEILPFSQSVFSAAFYMRVFKWEVGKENAFHVANDKENLVFKATALRKEKIKTDAGEFDAIVLKPEMQLKGQFRPMGDILFWLSDDDRKYILRIEAKIKIGTLVSEVVEIQPGR